MKQVKKEAISFTGERFLPGQSGRRIEADHLARYHFACQYVRDKKVLDIACGTGYAAPLLIGAGATRYKGVDISEESVQHAKGLYGSERSSFVVGDICKFDSIEPYDVIVSFETVEHVKCYRSALSNFFRILEPGGLLLISSPNRTITSPRVLNFNDKPANKFHTQEFTSSELLEELLAAGFDASAEDVFGQRQRWLYNCSYIQSLVRVTRFPDVFAFITSAEVTPVKNKSPRYFVVVAKKSHARA
jgi:SAM-dependent methyltransferase